MTGTGISRRWWIAALVITWGSLLALQEAAGTSTTVTMAVGACVGVLLVAVDVWTARRSRERAQAASPSLSSGSRPGSA